MGSGKSKELERGELSEEALNLIKEIFEEFDKDKSGSIDKAEALKYWQGHFGKVCAGEFFDRVDINNDGVVELEEFVDFWKIVKGAGHKEDEIMEELENLKNKETWRGFDDIPKHIK